MRNAAKLTVADSTTVKHQREECTNTFDEVLMSTTHGQSSTTALKRSTEE